MLTVQLASPASPLPPAPLAAVGIAVSGSGTCYGSQTLSVSIQSASGTTIAAPTCVQLASSAIPGSLMLGAASYPVTITVAGATAAPLVVARSTQLPGPVALGTVAISPASMQACLQGGTTTLQYSGALVVAG
ncbi:MAG TPA: hypothetical protein VGQ42_10375 [Candidatus Dormibacteraeota bacterium]|jgi:hypothetical protein|nr:hypothetical protein [Candidatus Dormibacteraeota bacterium]